MSASGAVVMAKADQPFWARVKRRCRDGSVRLRQTYVTARRAAAFVRDRHRRRIIHQLPQPLHPLLEEVGVLVLPPDAFGDMGDVVRQAHDAVSRFDREGASAGKSKKTFLVNVLHQDALTPTSPIIRFALRPDVLTIVSCYLGIAPLLTAVRVFRSGGDDTAPRSSQLYHCDGDDVRQVKIFIHCTAVTPEAGPLTFLDATATAAVQKHTRYRYDRHLRDEDVRSVPGVIPRPILGPPGTAAFIDTSRCLHFGSRIAGGGPPRLVTMIQYSTPYSFMLPVHYRDALPYRHLLNGSLSPLQRLTLGE